ncbi:MAG: hypothetical protein ABIH92_01380, partial [Nanoarchaeota archaeon]
NENEISDFYYLKITEGQDGRWVRLCRDVLVCVKTKTFSEGSNNILIKAVDRDGNVNVSDEIGFTIDSRKPRISRTMPRRNSFVNRSVEFVVRYTEGNLEKITLFYANGNKNKSNDSSCVSGRNEECVFTVNSLTDADGAEQEYWFVIEDVMGNNVSSRKTKLKVDTTAPVEEYFESVVDRRRVNFLFDIEELNFKEISYVDDLDANQRPKRLCSSIRNGLCTARKSFRPGNHTLTFTILDKAGNSQNRTDNFMIY